MRMSITAHADHEQWQRDFDGHVLTSKLRVLPDGCCVAERIGPIEVRMRPRVVEGGLDMPMVGLRVFGLPLPRLLLGSSGGQERATRDGAIRFSVVARAWGIGLVISYEGVLAQKTVY